MAAGSKSKPTQSLKEVKKRTKIANKYTHKSETKTNQNVTIKPKETVASLVPKKRSVEEMSFPRGHGNLNPVTSTSDLSKSSRLAKQALSELLSPELNVGSTPSSATTTPDSKNPRRQQREKRTRLSSKKSSETQDVEVVTVFHPTINAEHYVTGARVLGYVQAIFQDRVQIALPGEDITGEVSLVNISSQLTQIVQDLVAEEDLARIAEDEGGEGNSVDSTKVTGEDVNTQLNQDTLPPLQALFYSGQWLRFVVLGPSPKSFAGHVRQKFDLTTSPERVNYGLKSRDLIQGTTLIGSIQSIEDHGYVVDLGLGSVTGFCSFAEAAKVQSFFEHIRGDTLHVGQVLSFFVQNAIGQDQRVVQLSTKPSLGIRGSPELSLSSVDAVLPGMLVAATVTGMNSTGIECNVMDKFPAIIYWCYLANAEGFDQSLIDQNTVISQRLNVRVLLNASDLGTRWILASVSPYHVRLPATPTSHPVKLPPVGMILEAIVVDRVSHRSGLYCHMPGYPYVMGRVPSLHVHDKAKPDTASVYLANFRSGMMTRGRITAVNQADGHVTLSLRQSVLEEKYMTVQDVSVGDLVAAKVIAINPSNVIVALSSFLTARIPLHLLTDTPVLDVAQRFPLGTRLTCRVWQLYTDREGIVLIHRRSLVDPDALPLTDASQMKPGTLVKGLITAAKRFKFYISFYNSINGVLPYQEIPVTGDESPQQLYQEGQVITCQVLPSQDSSDTGVTPTPIRLTLRITDGKDSQVGQAQALDPALAGKMVSCVVKRAEPAALYLWVPSFKLLAIMPRFFYGDYQDSVFNHRYDVIQEGETLENCIVLKVDEEKQILVVAWKPLLAFASGHKLTLPTKDTPLTPGQLVPAVVTNVWKSGQLKLELMGGYQVKIGEGSVEHLLRQSLTKLYARGQTVLARVTKTVERDGEAALSVRREDTEVVWVAGQKTLAALPKGSEAKALSQFVTENPYIRSYFNAVETLEEGAAPLATIGTCIRVTLSQRLDNDEWEVKLGNSYKGRVSSGHTVPSLQAGQEVVARILDVDMNTRTVDLTLLPELVMDGQNKVQPATSYLDFASLVVELNQENAVRSAVANRYASLLALIASPGAIMVGQVQLIKEHYLVLSIPDCDHAIVFGSPKNLNQQWIDRDLRVGQLYHVKLLPSSLEAPLPRALVNLRDRIENTQLTALLNSKLVEPVDSQISFIQDLDVGKIVEVLISGVTGRQHLDLEVAKNVKGRVLPTELTDDIDPLPTTVSLLESHLPGQVVKAKIMGFYNPKKPHYSSWIAKPLKTAPWGVDLSLRASEVEPTSNGKLIRPFLSRKELQNEQSLMGFVCGHRENTVLVAISPKCLVAAYGPYVSKDPEVVENSRKHFPLGTLVNCTVSQKQGGGWAASLVKKVNLTAGLTRAALKNRSASTGVIHSGMVTQITPTGLLVNLTDGSKCYVPLTEYRDEYSALLPTWYTLGDTLRGITIPCATLPREAREALSLRVSRFPMDLSEASPVVKDPVVSSQNMVSPGTVIRGFVVNSSPQGLDVMLGVDVTAHVSLQYITDIPIAQPYTLYSPGRLVQGIILESTSSRWPMQMSLKPSDYDPNYRPLLLEDFSKGQVVKCCVLKVAEYGVVLHLMNSTVRALCLAQDLSDTPTTNPADLYTRGDFVKGVVLRIDSENSRMLVGLNASHLVGKDAELSSESNASDHENIGDIFNGDQFDDDCGGLLTLNSNVHDNVGQIVTGEAPVGRNRGFGWEDEGAHSSLGSIHPGSEASEDDEEMGVPVVNPVLNTATPVNQSGALPPPSIVPALRLKRGFGWDDGDAQPSPETNHSDSEESEDEVAGDVSEKTRKRRKHNKKSIAHLTEDVTADLDSALPALAEDYERLLLSSPNSSYLWINYMAFQLKLAEVFKAREIAERALKTINFREEQEKMNVWVAQFNLENQFGSQDELNAVIKRSLQFCDPKKVYVQLADMYTRSHKTSLAEQTYKTLLEKFSQSCKAWTLFASFYLAQGQPDKVQDLLQRCVQTLPKRKHLKAIKTFAVLEFKQGDAERGRTIFEGILSNYPNRLDLWSIYIDMETKTANITK
ncbi:rRNA biogenesis protein rrp5, partial [Dispira simplex]